VASDRSMCPGTDSDSKREYQDIPGSKGGRCVRLKTYHLHVPIVKKSGGLNLLEPRGPVQASNGTALPFRIIKHHIFCPKQEERVLHISEDKMEGVINKTQNCCFVRH